MHAIFAPTIAAALLLPPLAAAQDQSQSQSQSQSQQRLGNIWDNKDHALPPDQTDAQEKSAGVALSPQQQRGQTDEVEALEKQLLRATHEGPGAPGAGGH